MSNIKNYFSPSCSSSGKRQRSKSSPELENNFKKQQVGEKVALSVNMDDITKKISDLLDAKIACLATKADVNSIFVEIKKISVENVKLREDYQQLKSENDKIMSKLVELENRSRRSNVIFRGLQCQSEGDVLRTVKEFCTQVLKARPDIVINRAHFLGAKKSNSSPIIAHIPWDNDLKGLYKNAKYLKGTNFQIHPDFAVETRKVRGLLIRLRKEINKIESGRRMFLVVDRLVIEGTSFTFRNGRLMAGDEDGEEKLAHILGTDVGELMNKVYGNASDQA